MRLKLFIAAWISRRLERYSRRERRALRDYQRQELRRIQRAEKRSRGLRLFIGWSRPPKAVLVTIDAEEWRNRSNAAPGPFAASLLTRAQP